MNITPPKPEPSVCASCGETFGCGAKLAGCWCTEVTISAETTTALAKEFDGCLCPKCLGDVSAKRICKQL